MRKTGRFIGILIRGVVFGTLLTIAMIHLLSLASGARIFRYEGY